MSMGARPGWGWGPAWDPGRNHSFLHMAEFMQTAVLASDRVSPRLGVGAARAWEARGPRGSMYRVSWS